MYYDEGLLRHSPAWCLAYLSTNEVVPPSLVLHAFGLLPQNPAIELLVIDLTHVLSFFTANSVAKTELCSRYGDDEHAVVPASTGAAPLCLRALRSAWVS